MILIVGGAGYIGSHVVHNLIRNNYRVVVLDNLSTGHREAVHPQAIFIEGDLADPIVIQHVFSHYPIEGVMHFAANAYVGESVEDPVKYYSNNVAATVNLLMYMVKHHIQHFIFSSTCAVYGIPKTESVDETTLTSPISPYGRTKLMVEQILQDISEASPFRYVILRYFNAAGADECGDIGEDHRPESHLIPIVMEHLLGKRDCVHVYGSDYDTHDGTCIRDYVHVNDLAEAHIMAYEQLIRQAITNETYNLGNGTGYSVNEIIEGCERVTGRKAVVNYVERRAGDPPKIIASSEKIVKELGWKPRYDLHSMLHTAWKWHNAHPNGYRTAIHTK